MTVYMYSLDVQCNSEFMQKFALQIQQFAAVTGNC